MYQELTKVEVATLVFMGVIFMAAISVLAVMWGYSPRLPKRKDNDVV